MQLLEGKSELEVITEDLHKAANAIFDEQQLVLVSQNYVSCCTRAYQLSLRIEGDIAKLQKMADVGPFYAIGVSICGLLSVTCVWTLLM